MSALGFSVEAASSLPKESFFPALRLAGRVLLFLKESFFPANEIVEVPTLLKILSNGGGVMFIPHAVLAWRTWWHLGWSCFFTLICMTTLKLYSWELWRVFCLDQFIFIVMLFPLLCYSYILMYSSTAEEDNQYVDIYIALSHQYMKSSVLLLR